LRVVRNLVMFHGTGTIFLAAYAFWMRRSPLEIVSLVFVAILSSIPVALPSIFTLAASVGARSLARRGVLPTSLSRLRKQAVSLSFLNVHSAVAVGPRCNPYRDAKIFESVLCAWC
jgi:hypothetical protein